MQSDNNNNNDNNKTENKDYAQIKKEDIEGLTSDEVVLYALNFYCKKFPDLLKYELFKCPCCELFEIKPVFLPTCKKCGINVCNSCRYTDKKICFFCFEKEERYIQRKCMNDCMKEDVWFTKSQNKKGRKGSCIKCVKKKRIEDKESNQLCILMYLKEEVLSHE